MNYDFFFDVFNAAVKIATSSFASLIKSFNSFSGISSNSEINSSQNRDSSDSSSTIFNLLIKSAFDLALQTAL